MPTDLAHCAAILSPRVVKSLTNYCEEKIRGEDQMVIFIHNIQTEGETPGSILGSGNLTFYLVVLLWFHILNYLQTLPTLHLSEQYFRGEWANQIYWTLFPFKLPQRKIVLFYVSSELVQLKETEQNSGSSKKFIKKNPSFHVSIIKHLESSQIPGGSQCLPLLLEKMQS